MIFNDSKYESEFDFGSSKKIVLSDNPYKQLASAILNTIEKIEKSFRDDEKAIIYYRHALKEYGIEYLEFSKIDIYPTIKEIQDQVQKSDSDRIQGILRKMGVNKPEEKDERNFILYLKLEYLFYFMRYYIFPKPQKFYDLYKEENKTIETVLGENYKYSWFILDNLSDEVLYSKENKESGTFKSGYNWPFYLERIQQYYSIILELFVKQDNLFYNSVFWENVEKTLNIRIDDYTGPYEIKAFLNIFTSFFNQRMKSIKSKYIFEKVDNPINKLVDFMYDFEKSALISDYRTYFDDYFGKLNIKNHPEMPQNFGNKSIYLEGIESFIESEEFLNWIDSSKKKIENKRKEVQDSKVVDILERIWSFCEIYLYDVFEKDKSGNLYITADVIAGLVWAVIKLDENDIYYAKSINLTDRREKLKSSERKLRNEFHYYSRNRHWRGNMEMPIAVILLLISKALIETVEGEEDFNFVAFLIELAVRIFITIEDELAGSSIIERYVYIRALYKQLRIDIGDTP